GSEVRTLYRAPSFLSLPHRQPINDCVVIYLPRLQHGCGEVGMVGRIGEMLRLHAESVSKLINPSALARDRAIEEVARIKLQPRFARQHLEHASASWFVHAGDYA